MSVIIGLSTSVDGIAAGVGTDEAEFWRVHEATLGWLFNLRSWQQAQGMDGGEDNDDSRLVAREQARIGAQVVGRRMFDFAVEAWGDDPPFHVPVFIPTHRPQARIAKAGGTSYTFVADVAEAVEQATAAAGGKDVLIAGGLSTAREALAAGLVDELSMHIAPVVLGDGARLLDGIGRTLRLRPLEVSGSANVTHVRYAVEG